MKLFLYSGLDVTIPQSHIQEVPLFWLSVLAWPSPGHCGYLWGETMDEQFL